MEIGVGLWDPRVNPEEHIDPWRMVEVAEMADRMGFSYLAMPDRVSRPIPRFDTLTLMAALALRTETIRFLTHVFVTPLREPIELARRIVTIDHLSSGRFVLGAGLGGGEKVGGPDLTVYQKEFVDVGIDIRERGQRTDGSPIPRSGWGGTRMRPCNARPASATAGPAAWRTPQPAWAAPGRRSDVCCNSSKIAAAPGRSFTFPPRCGFMSIPTEPGL